MGRGGRQPLLLKPSLPVNANQPTASYPFDTLYIKPCADYLVTVSNPHLIVHHSCSIQVAFFCPIINCAYLYLTLGEDHRDTAQSFDFSVALLDLLPSVFHCFSFP